MEATKTTNQLEDMLEKLAREREDDLALIRQVNANRKRCESTRRVGCSVDDPDVFVRVVGDGRPVKVTVKQPAVSVRDAERAEFWLGTIFGAIIGSGIIVALWSLATVVLPMIWR